MKKCLVLILLIAFFLCFFSCSFLHTSFAASTGGRKLYYVYDGSWMSDFAQGESPEVILDNCRRLIVLDYRVEYRDEKTSLFQYYLSNPDLFFDLTDYKIKKAYCLHGDFEIAIYYVTDKGGFIYFENASGETGLFPLEHFYDFSKLVKIAGTRLAHDAVGHTYYPAAEYFDLTPYTTDTVMTAGRYEALTENYVPTVFPEELLEDGKDKNGTVWWLIGIGVSACVIVGGVVAFCIFRKKRKMKQS